MLELGKLDLRIASLIAPSTDTDCVILTEERIAHIAEHHPGDYEKYGHLMAASILTPSFVLMDPRHACTGIYVKQFEVGNQEIHVRTTVRYHVPGDEEDFTNSVLTFQYIRKQEYRRLRKKETWIVYKSENI